MADPQAVGDADRAIEARILELLSKRAPGVTICPSEVARAAYDGKTDDGWRPLMDVVRAAAGRLVDAGEVEVTQGGEVVDLTTAKGPIRLRKRS